MHVCVKTTFQTEILVPIDRSLDVPLHVQLERQLRSAVRTGRLRAHTPLPSTRSLAADLGLSRGVVVGCYEQLVAEGYFVSSAGSRTRVAVIRTQAPRPRIDATTAPKYRYDFVPGTPDVTAFPRSAWLACLKRAFKAASDEAFHYPHPKGPAVTRLALATWLARSRATVADEDRVIVCNGFAQGIDLVARLLKAKGVRCVAIENPGFGALGRRFRDVGIVVERIPVDDRGLVVQQLGATDATAVVVTPAHQFPTGAGMTPDRRAALLAWSAKRNALIIEDDYDAEYRYDREPLGALQGLAPNRVIYIGTGSKILSPALRLGWVIVPEMFASELGVLKQGLDGGSPTFDQLALAEFLTSGQMDRHLRRMRQIYRRRRDVLVDAVHEFLPRFPIGGVSAGLHLMLKLPSGTDEKQLIRAAHDKSIRIFGASDYRGRSRTEDAAIVLGYGCVTETLIRQGVRELAELIARSSST